MNKENNNDIEQDNFDPNDEIKNWDELEIDINLLRGIYAYGFEKPSPIQCKAIKPLLQGRDVISQAQSGCGKTATFVISALSKVKLNEKTTQVLILSPTRELSKQSFQVTEHIGSMMPELKLMNLVGGDSYQQDIQKLKMSPPHIITGCPGRIYDMLQRGAILPEHIDFLVLDEADVLLSSDFKDQVYQIFQYLKQDVQVGLFSATLPSFVFPIVNKIMRNPVKIYVKAESLTLEGIRQYFVAVENDDQKYDTLKDLYSYLTVSQCIIYCNSVERVMHLYNCMKKDQFPVCCIHSNMDKTERDNAFQEFKSGQQRVLISSNVTARGIDIQQVSVVINFDIPHNVSTYLHRIGRSGRWGRKGTGINLITKKDVYKMKEIESYYSTEIKELPNSLQTLF